MLVASQATQCALRYTIKAAGVVAPAATPAIQKPPATATNVTHTLSSAASIFVLVRGEATGVAGAGTAANGGVVFMPPL